MNTQTVRSEFSQEVLHAPEQYPALYKTEQQKNVRKFNGLQTADDVEQ